MLQERPNGNVGGGHLWSEPQNRQPMLRPAAAQGNSRQEYPLGAAGNRQVRIRQVLLWG